MTDASLAERTPVRQDLLELFVLGRLFVELLLTGRRIGL